jgi:hypothetical protein
MKSPLDEAILAYRASPGYDPGGAAILAGGRTDELRACREVLVRHAADLADGTFDEDQLNAVMDQTENVIEHLIVRLGLGPTEAETITPVARLQTC